MTTREQIQKGNSKIKLIGPPMLFLFYKGHIMYQTEYEKKKELGNTVSIRSAVQQNRIVTTVLFSATLLLENPSLEQSHADETVL